MTSQSSTVTSPSSLSILKFCAVHPTCALLVAPVQVAQRLQKAHEAGKAAAWTDCEVVVARVEGDLAAAHQAIQQERAARERLEQEMKRAFMRGVCALNIEVRRGAIGLDACCQGCVAHGHCWDGWTPSSGGARASKGGGP